jgi:hypothetical protein
VAVSCSRASTLAGDRSTVPLDEPVRLRGRVEDLVVVLQPEAREVEQQVMAVGQREVHPRDLWHRR